MLDAERAEQHERETLQHLASHSALRSGSSARAQQVHATEEQVGHAAVKDPSRGVEQASERLMADLSRCDDEIQRARERLKMVRHPPSE